MRSIAFAKHELRWFFVEAEGDLGLRGIDYDRSGGEVDPHEIASRRIDDVARWTNVATRLRAIGVEHERVLRLAFTPHRWPGLERWYELAGVAALIVNSDDILGGARFILGLTPEKAELLRAGAAGKLRIALVYYLSGKTVAPKPSRHLVDLPPVRDKKRTWAPIARTPIGRCLPALLGRGGMTCGRAFRWYNIQGDPLMRPAGWASLSPGACAGQRLGGRGQVAVDCHGEHAGEPCTDEEGSCACLSK